MMDKGESDSFNFLHDKGIVKERLVGIARYETVIEVAKQTGLSGSAVTNRNEFAGAVSILL